MTFKEKKELQELIVKEKKSHSVMETVVTIVFVVLMLFIASLFIVAFATSPFPEEVAAALCFGSICTVGFITVQSLLNDEVSDRLDKIERWLADHEEN